MFKKSLILAMLLIGGNVTAQQTIDPRGLYFNRFTGSFSGTEYFQVIPGDTPGTFLMNDIFGGGFTVMVDEQGNIQFPNGSGQFSDPDNFVITPSIGGTTFTFTNNRIPMTTPDFLLELDSPLNNGTPLDGSWTNLFGTINPETGVADPLSEETITLSTDGNTVRITDPFGNFVQGVFETAETAVLRQIGAQPGGRFAAVPGSSSTFGDDLLGTLIFDNVNEYRLIFALQTQAPLGQQTQTMFQFIGSRQTPLVRGDVNGDGAVNDTDRAAAEALSGLTANDNGFNLAADLHRDGVIDIADLVAFDGLQFTPNAGLSGAWANPATLGQGLLFDVFPADDTHQVFVAWFAYDVNPPDGALTEFGATEHRWFTAQGTMEGNTANLTLSLTNGGIFDDPTATTTIPVGNLTVSFSNCTEAAISYRFDNSDLNNTFQIQRLTPNTFCQDSAIP